MNGDRFKKRLPKFLGKISDFEDLLIAEDKEFNKIDRNIDRFDKGLFINTLNDMENPDEYLKRLEKDYGLSSIGSYEERINAILVKRRAKEPTIPYRVEELGNYYSNANNIVNFIPEYEEYSFIVEFLISRGVTDIQGFINALEEIKPAHLSYIKKLISQHNIYIGMTAISGKKRTHYPLVVKDRTFNHEIYYGMVIIRQKRKRVFKKYDELY